MFIKLVGTKCACPSRSPALGRGNSELKARNVFKPPMTTGIELFSCLTCLDTTTFTLSSIFSLIETIGSKIWEGPLFWYANCSLPVSVHSSKRRLLNLSKLSFMTMLKAAFKWLSNVITWLQLLRQVFGLKISRLFFIQWEASPKPMAPWVRVFGFCGCYLKTATTMPFTFLLFRLNTVSTVNLLKKDIKQTLGIMLVNWNWKQKFLYLWKAVARTSPT